MHEMSLCEGLLQILEEEAARQDFSRVKKVSLEVGALAGVEISALTFCFDVVCKDTLADSAKLEIKQTPGQGWCMQCACTVDISERFSACPHCNGYQIQVTGGDEMQIKQLEVA